MACKLIENIVVANVLNYLRKKNLISNSSTVFYQVDLLPVIYWKPFTTGRSQLITGKL